MDGDAVLQLVVADFLSVELLLQAFADDVERPVGILLSEDVEGIDQ